MDGKSNHIKILELAYCAIFTVLIVVCSWISIPFTIPFTLQTFAICLTAALMGTRRSLYSIIAYILLGCIGIPVFSGFNSGVGVLFGTTGGYIVGFIFTALIIGTCTKAFGKSTIVLAISMAVGILVCYVFGTAWFMLMYAKTTGAVGLMTVLGWCVFPYILPDCLKIALAIFLVKRLDQYINK